MYSNIDHCKVVSDSLTGQRPADEQTFASITTLAEKLQTVQKLHRCMIDVEFSPHVQALAEQEMVLAIS